MPAKKPRTEVGVLSRCCNWSISSVASLRETPGARLKETVTEGNRPVWFKASGVVVCVGLAMVNSGVLPVLVVFEVAEWK